MECGQQREVSKESQEEQKRGLPFHKHTLRARTVTSTILIFPTTPSLPILQTCRLTLGGHITLEGPSRQDLKGQCPTPKSWL